MASRVDARGSVAPRSIFFTDISDTPDALARSVCFQPIRARAARIWAGVIMTACNMLPSVAAIEITDRVILMLTGTYVTATVSFVNG